MEKNSAQRMVVQLAATSGLLLLSAGSAAAMQVVVSGVTATQAVLTYTSPAEGACTVEVSTAASMQPVVHDVNGVLFPGASSDARYPEMVSGPSRVFVVGQRRAERAADGRWRSRALQAFTTHYFRVTCGAEAATGSFTTANPALGNTYPELPPFDAERFGNYGWPSIDFGNRAETYIDPMTGILIKRATGPGDVGLVWAGQLFSHVVDSQGTWTNPNNARSGALDQVSTTSTTNPLFLPVGGMNFDSGDMAGWQTYSWGIDDLRVKLSGSSNAAAAADRAVELCWSVDSGQSCQSAVQTHTLSPLAGVSLVPGSFPAPSFASWGGVPIPRALIAPPSGKVDVAGNVVTLRGNDPVSFFNTDWRPGSLVYIAGSATACPGELCSIAAVRSSSSLVLNETVGTLSNVDYRGANFGLIVRKKTGAGSVSLSVGYEVAVSRMFTMPGNGSSDLCSKNRVSTNVNEAGAPIFPPIEGYLCIVQGTPSGSALYFFAPSTGEFRLLSQFAMEGKFSGPSQDVYGSGFIRVPVNSFHPTDGRKFYTSRSTGFGPYYTVLFEGNYTGDFRALPAGYGYKFNDSIQWRNLTPASENKDFRKLIEANPKYNSAFFPYVTGIAMVDKYYMFNASIQQDAPCILGFLNVDTGQLTATRDSWSTYPGRWGTCHTIEGANAGTWTMASMNPARFPSSGVHLQGPYKLTVQQVFKGGTWSNDTSLTESFAEACPADLKDSWKQLGATGNICIRVRVAGEPCSSTPTQAEKTQFPCPTNPNHSMLQPMEEGDLISDFRNNTCFGCERFRIVRKTVIAPDNIELWLQRRGYNPQPDLITRIPALYRHPSGWQPQMVPNNGFYGAGWWIDASGQTPGWKLENYLITASHKDIGAAPTAGQYTMVTGNYSARFDQSVPTQFDTPLNTVINGHPDFAGDKNFPGDGYIETYPSVRQWNAPAAEKRWALDWRAYQNGNGLSAESKLGLFNTTVTLVNGTQQVYKIRSPFQGNRKVMPTLAWAGRFLLRDKSGPNSLLADEDTWSFCVADFAGECRPGSQARDTFVNVPKATLDGTCYTNHYASHAPCVVTASPVGASIVQWDISRTDSSGTRFRRLTMGLSGPGRQFTYANARSTPEGGWAIFQGYWLDGYRNDLLVAKLPPWPDSSTTNRGSFVPVRIQVNESPDTWRVRVRFGYRENGPVSSFACTSRNEACITTGLTPFAPFSWESEAPSLPLCNQGCSLVIPAISGRVVYYQVERVNGQGETVSRDPIQAVAVD